MLFLARAERVNRRGSDLSVGGIEKAAKKERRRSRARVQNRRKSPKKQPKLGARHPNWAPDTYSFASKWPENLAYVEIHMDVHHELHCIST